MALLVSIAFEFRPGNSLGVIRPPNSFRQNPHWMFQWLRLNANQNCRVPASPIRTSPDPKWIPQAVLPTSVLTWGVRKSAKQILATLVVWPLDTGLEPNRHHQYQPPSVDQFGNPFWSVSNTANAAEFCVVAGQSYLKFQVHCHHWLKRKKYTFSVGVHQASRAPPKVGQTPWVIWFWLDLPPSNFKLSCLIPVGSLIIRTQHSIH